MDSAVACLLCSVCFIGLALKLNVIYLTYKNIWVDLFQLQVENIVPVLYRLRSLNVRPMGHVMELH